MPTEMALGRSYWPPLSGLAGCSALIFLQEEFNRGLSWDCYNRGVETGGVRIAQNVGGDTGVLGSCFGSLHGCSGFGDRSHSSLLDLKLCVSFFSSLAPGQKRRGKCGEYLSIGCPFSPIRAVRGGAVPRSIKFGVRRSGATHGDYDYENGINRVVRDERWRDLMQRRISLPIDFKKSTVSLALSR